MLLAAAVLLVAGVVGAQLAKMSAWQVLTTLTLCLYIVFNYGFNNLSYFSLPLGYLLLVLALVLCIAKFPTAIGELVKEPIFICFFALLVLSGAHLVFDFPRYGLYAVRDANFVYESVAVLLGYAWARTPDARTTLIRALKVIFILNLIYSFTYPVEDWLLANSPQSGVFRPTPLLGHYAGNSLFLVLGGLFFLLVGRSEIRWNRVIIFLLGLIQISWSFIFQNRSMYLGILIAAIIVLLFGEAKKSVRATMYLFASFALLLVIVQLFGVTLSGRIGEVTLQFLVEHFKSIFLWEGTPAVGSAQWRLDLLPEVFRRWSASVQVVLFGEGFGRPLIDFVVDGAEVRQPHNTHLTVLARLGLLGMVIWVSMWTWVTVLLFRSVRITKTDSDRTNHEIFLILFVFFALGMLRTSLQPWLEFTYGAVPFYFFVGYIVAYAKRSRFRPQSVST